MTAEEIAWMKAEMPCLADARHTFPPGSDHCFCRALRRPPVDVAEVTLFTPATGKPDTRLGWSKLSMTNAIGGPQTGRGVR